MVKPLVPPEIEGSLDWILKTGDELFTGLVPYGVHLALSVYEDRKEEVGRGLEGRRGEGDAVIAT